MALSPRQRLCYEDLCDIWAPSFTVAGTGAPSAVDSWTKIASSVAYYHEPNPSLDDWDVEGRIERDIIYTLEAGHFAEDQTIDADYIVKNVSLSAGGANSENYGRFWKVRGHPLARPQRRRRNSGKKKVLMSALPAEEVPTGVS